jgi:hypothetical protein
MTARDNTSPTATNLSGDLVANPAWRGPLPVAFDAGDSGSGVYRPIVNLDGQDALGQVVDPNGGRCADADQTDTDPHEFLYPVPCRTSVNAQLTVDTGTLPRRRPAGHDRPGGHRRQPVGDVRPGAQDDRAVVRQPRRRQRHAG